MHPQPIIASILVCGVIAVVAMIRPRGEELVFGDVPRIPREMRPAHLRRGESGQGGLAVTRTLDRTHVGSGL